MGSWGNRPESLREDQFGPRLWPLSRRQPDIWGEFQRAEGKVQICKAHWVACTLRLEDGVCMTEACEEGSSSGAASRPECVSVCPLHRVACPPLEARPKGHIEPLPGPGDDG